MIIQNLIITSTEWFNLKYELDKINKKMNMLERKLLLIQKIKAMTKSNMNNVNDDSKNKKEIYELKDK